MVWPFLSRRERLRRQASDWVARLNGPVSERDRAAFDDWYRASPDHSAAYDRLSALFRASAHVQRPVRAPARAQRIFRPAHYALAAMVCGILVAAVFLVTRQASPAGSDQIATFSTARAGQRIVLADGSIVLLSPESVLEVAISPNLRRLRLMRGEGRFNVRSDPRPFVVAANGTEVTARGTEFVVSLTGGRTLIALIEGRVDVSHLVSGSRSSERRVTSLSAGQRLVVPSAQAATALPTSPSPLPTAAVSQVMIEFDETPLSDAIARMTGRGRPEIRLEDARLGQLRVTGAYRAGDTRGFAESVAAAFSLVLERGTDGSLLLRRAQGGRPSL